MYLGHGTSWTHSAQSSHRERSRGVGKGGKGGKREGKASTTSRCWTGHRQRPSRVVSGKSKRQFWQLGDHWVFYICFCKAGGSGRLLSFCMPQRCFLPAWPCLHSEPIHCLPVMRIIPMHPSETLPSPALVSLLSLSFHLADGLICFVVFSSVWFCGLFCFVWFALVADRILPICRDSFRVHSSPAILALGAA